VLILSRTPSIFMAEGSGPRTTGSGGITIKVDTSHSHDTAIVEDSADSSLTRSDHAPCPPVRPSPPLPTLESAHFLQTQRLWWALCRLLSPTMSESMTTVAEQDFVSTRRVDRLMSVSLFEDWLVMVRLVAASVGSDVIHEAHWGMMRELERRRAARRNIAEVGLGAGQRSNRDPAEGSGRTVGTYSPTSVITFGAV